MGSKSKLARWLVRCCEAKGEVFFGSGGEVDDPGLAVAIFDCAVVGLVFEEEAAVFHGKSSMR